MTKRISLAVALVFIAAGAASAQSNAQSTANVTLTVEQGLSITKPGNADLAFGTVVAGAGALTVDPAADAAAVEFRVAGEPNRPITISSSMLAADGATADALSSGANTIAFTTNLIYTQAAQGVQGGAAISGAEALSAGGGGSIWMGGNLNVPNGTPGGAYSGTLTLTVQY